MPSRDTPHTAPLGPPNPGGESHDISPRHQGRTKGRSLAPILPPPGLGPGGTGLALLGRAARLLLLTALVLAGSAAPASGAQRAHPATAPARAGIGELYLALGDSLGVGLFSSAPETRSYVAQFHGLLEQAAGRPVQVENLSVNGETAKSMLTGAQLQDAERTIAEARERGWTISPVTIDIGGNDMRALQNKSDAEREAGLAEFRGNVARIFDRLVAATTVEGARTSDIITMTVYNPYGGDVNAARSLAWWVERFNAALAEEAQRRDIAVAPVYDRFRGQERALTLVPLDFHANNRGHRAIAEEFWRAAGYDTAAPDVEIVDPAAARPARPVTTIKVRAADNIGVARVELLLDDKPLPAPLFKPDLDLWIGYWDARAAAPGAHRLAIVVTDAAGNTTRRDLALAR